MNSKEPSDLPAASGEKTAYWYNSKTGEVEFGLLTAALFRVGPFASADEAARAPEILRERAAAWRAEDAEDD